MKSFWILKAGPMEHIYLRPIEDDTPLQFRVISASTVPTEFLSGGTRSGKEVRFVGTPLNCEPPTDATENVLVVFDPDDTPNASLAMAPGNIVEFGDMGLEVISFGQGVIPG